MCIQTCKYVYCSNVCAYVMYVCASTLILLVGEAEPGPFDKHPIFYERLVLIGRAGSSAISLYRSLLVGETKPLASP